MSVVLLIWSVILVLVGLVWVSRHAEISRVGRQHGCCARVIIRRSKARRRGFLCWCGDERGRD